jgi:hypothetical protein
MMEKTQRTSTGYIIPERVPGSGILPLKISLLETTSDIRQGVKGGWVGKNYRNIYILYTSTSKLWIPQP